MTDSIEDFLAPLARLAEQAPGVEGLVIWAEDGAWPASDTPTEALEAEEIAFYAEGLLLEGFGMAWDILALPDDPEEPLAVRLMVWQGAAPPPPAAPKPWITLDRKERPAR